MIRRVSTEIPVDDETRAALLLFNERLEASAAADRAAKRIAKAERAKTEAAAAVRKVGDNPNASAEEKAEAEARYKEAVDAFNTIRDNPDAEMPKATQPEDAGAEADSDPDPEPTEVSADEEAPAAASSASEEE